MYLVALEQLLLKTKTCLNCPCTSFCTWAFCTSHDCQVLLLVTNMCLPQTGTMWLPASGCMSSFCTLLHRITLVKLAWSKDCCMHLLPASKLLVTYCDFVPLCRIILVRSAWSVSCCPFPAWLAGSLFLPAHCPQYRCLCFFACCSHCVHTLAVSLVNAALDSTQL